MKDLFNEFKKLQIVAEQEFGAGPIPTNAEEFYNDPRVRNVQDGLCAELYRRGYMLGNMYPVPCINFSGYGFMNDQGHSIIRVIATIIGLN